MQKDLMTESPARGTAQPERLFIDKPERVIDLPADAAGARRAAVVEIAGRDSVAAAVRCVEQEGFTDLVPTYAYTGTEHGPWDCVPAAVRRLERCLPEVRVHPMVVLGSPGFWQALNGRFISALVAAFGFYTPCVGCHLYLHAVRVPLARRLGNLPIIAGERESHDGDEKINQCAAALDAYRGLVQRFGLDLLLPLRRETDGRNVEALAGGGWAQGAAQMGCVLSGNYRGKSPQAELRPQQIQPFLEAFALPCAGRIVETYLQGRVPDHLGLAAELVARLPKRKG
jgi:hypothetical protein